MTKDSAGACRVSWLNRKLHNHPCIQHKPKKPALAEKTEKERELRAKQKERNEKTDRESMEMTHRKSIHVDWAGWEPKFPPQPRSQECACWLE